MAQVGDIGKWAQIPASVSQLLAHPGRQGGSGESSGPPPARTSGAPEASADHGPRSH